MKTLIKRGLTSITVIVLGLVLLAVTALSATRAVADIVYQDDRETISVTLVPNDQEYWYYENGSVSPDNFSVTAQVGRTEPDRGLLKKCQRIKSLNISGYVGLNRPLCNFNMNIPITPFSDGTLYRVCKDQGPIDVTIERPLKMGLYDKNRRLVREVSVGPATALVHCPERVPDQPPRGPAPQVLTSSSCTRGVDCPPDNNSMALGGRAQGSTSSQQQTYTKMPQTAYAAGTEQSENATDLAPRYKPKPRIVNRESLAGERTVSSPGIKTLPQRLKPVTPTTQAPGQRWTATGTARKTGSKGVIVGTAREPGTRGIVMGTCRDLQDRPLRRPTVGKDGTGKLLFALPDGQSMVLPDGVYKAQNGIRLHFSGGRISLVDGILPK